MLKSTAKYPPVLARWKTSQAVLVKSHGQYLHVAVVQNIYHHKLSFIIKILPIKIEVYIGCFSYWMFFISPFFPFFILPIHSYFQSSSIFHICIFTGQPPMLLTMGVNHKSAKQLILLNQRYRIVRWHIYTWFYCRSFYTPLGRAGTTAENE